MHDLRRSPEWPLRDVALQRDREGATVRRFRICLLVASAFSLIQPPAPAGRSRGDVFGLAVYFVAVLLVAFAFYAAVLVVERLRARGRRVVKVQS